MLRSKHNASLVKIKVFGRCDKVHFGRQVTPDTIVTGNDVYSTHPTPATTTSRSTGRWINTPQCHHRNVPHNTNRKSLEPSEHQMLQFHVISRLVITVILTTT
jgi:hypothetical protein